jgi:hypothetical protein
LFSTKGYLGSTTREIAKKAGVAEVRRYPTTVVNIHRTFVDEIFETLVSNFRKMQNLKELRDFHPEIGEMAFVGMFFAFLTFQEFLRSEESGSDTEQVTKEFVEIFMKGTIQ